MYSITDEQIEFILNDIKQRGVKIESLQLNLLDHICCIIEKDPEAEHDFEKVYEKTIRTFFKTELAEIEKETLILLKFKHYYAMKRVLYLLLFLSISYNIYVITSESYKYYESKRFWSETTVIKDITIQEGSKYLFQKLKEEHPNIVIQDKIFVGFLGDFFTPNVKFDYTEIAETMGITTDSVVKQFKASEDKKYYRVDSLANIYKNVTFVIAYQSTVGDIDEKIKEYKTKTSNLLFITDMNKLYSGYENSRTNYKIHPKGTRTFPTLFVIDIKGNLIYQDKKLWDRAINKDLIKTLSGK
jgi:hypothetical protein